MKCNRRVFNKFTTVSTLGLLSSAGAIANAVSTTPKDQFYFQINMFGSPSRWYFDSILKPHAHSEFIHKNKMVSTKIDTTTTELKAEYQTVKFNNINAPLLWNEKIIQNKELRIGNLFDQALIIRGCDMILDGHEAISRKLVTPFLGGESLTGRLTDYSRLPFPTVQFLQASSPLSSTPGAFNSKKSLSPINLFERVDYFDFMFSEKMAKKLSKKEISAIDRINKFLNIKKVDLKFLENLTNKDIRKLKKEYLNNVKRYQSIIRETTKSYSNMDCFQKTISGLKTNQLIPSLSKYPNSLDYLGAYYIQDNFIADENLLKCLKNIKFPKLAEQFAMSELLTKHKISNTFVLMMIPPYDIKLNKLYSQDNLNIDHDNKIIKTKAKPFAKNFEFTFDTHEEGLLIDFVVNNAYFYTLSHCIHELKQFLIKEKLYNDSLIHIVSEFERTPKHNLAGSDHGFQEHTSTLISGKFDSLHIAGNIYTNSTSEEVLNNNNGTWGMGAPHAILKDRKVSYRNVLNTITDLLSIPSLSKSDTSLVYRKNNKWFPTIKAENISWES